MEARDRRLLLAVSILWLVHTAGLVTILADPTSLLDARPFLDQDWGLHQTHLESIEAFWNENGLLWGYSPNFMAGYPSNTHLDASIKAFELGALFTPGVATVHAFKLWVFAATSAIPLLILVASRNLADRPRTAWIDVVAATLATASWWSGFGREMLFYGMVGWPVGCALALFVLSLFWRILESTRRIGPAHVGWALGCALLLPVHLQAALFLPLPGLALLLTHPRRREPVLWAWAVGGVGFALAANAFWLVPLFAHFADENAGRVVASLPVFVSLDAWTFLKDYFTASNYWSFRETAIGNVFRILILGLGAAGLTDLLRRGRTPLAAGLMTLVLSLFVMTYFGSFQDRIQLLQPLRFKLPLDLSLCLCAGFAFDGWSTRRDRARVLLASALFVAWLAAGLAIGRTEATGRMKIHVEPLPPIAALVDWLDRNASRDGRILFEESGDETGFVYGGAYLSSFLPGWTGHQLIGGPTNLYADRHAFAELHSGRLFGRDPREFSDAELKRYLDLYNIGTVVAFHPTTVGRLGQLGRPLRPVRRFGRHIRVFRVEGPLDWFLEGEGRVEAKLGELLLNDLRPDPESQSVLLKYHWIEGLRAEPHAVIEPVLLEDDPIPFLRIQNPPPRLRIAVGD